VLDVVPLSVATGNVRVYFTVLSYSRRLVVTLRGLDNDTGSASISTSTSTSSRVTTPAAFDWRC
jgi:hypothetical protein